MVAGPTTGPRADRPGGPAPAPVPAPVDPAVVVGRLAAAGADRAVAGLVGLDLPGLCGLLTDAQALAGWVTACTLRVTAAIAEQITAEFPPEERVFDADLTVPTIATAARWNDGQAGARLQLAHQLTSRLPATLAGLTAGRLSYVHAMVIAETLAELPDRLAGELDPQLAALAQTRTPSQTRRLAGRLVRAATATADPPAGRRPDTPPDAQEAARQERLRQAAEQRARELGGGPERGLRLDPSGLPDGRYYINGELPGDEAQLLSATLERLAGRDGPDDHRHAEVRRADALIELARRADTTSPTPLLPPPFRIMMLAPAGLLPRPDGLPNLPGQPGPAAAAAAGRTAAAPRPAGQAELADGTPVSQTALLRWACQCPWELARTAPDAGRLLDLHPLARAASPPLRRYLVIRDGTCRFPNCTRAAHRCEIHHLTAYSAGGKTIRINLICLCSRHHHVVHDAHWIILGDPETSTLTFIGPDHHPHPSPPAGRPDQLSRPSEIINPGHAPDPDRDRPPPRAPG